jgi:hypothetical protein
VSMREKYRSQRQMCDSVGGIRHGGVREFSAVSRVYSAPT